MADYAFVHEGKAYTPNGSDVSAEQAAERNKAIEQAELKAWAEKPDRFVGYFVFPEEDKQENKTYRREFYPNRQNARVTTWLGSNLGYISYARVWPHNFGGRMVSIMVRGNNGALYHGTASYDNGTCINLRRNKE